MGLILRDKRYDTVKLTFKEEGHSYHDNFNNPYTSTTTILGNYKPAFDRSYWLHKKSIELGISEKALAAQWDNITTEACDRGNVTHDGLENGIKLSSMFKSAVKYMTKPNGEMITIADLPDFNMNVKELDIKEFKEATENKYPEVYAVFDYYTNNGYKIYAEIGAFLIDFLLSGTIDVLCIREDQFVIGDWKTNRGGLIFESGYYKKDKKQTPAQTTDIWVPKKETLLPPLNHLPNCNGYIYNMQLSIYAFMVEYVLGIPCRGLWLCHIDSDFILNEYGMPKRFSDGMYKVKTNPVEKCTLHKMKYLKEEVKAILNDRRNIINATKMQVANSRTLFD